MLNYVFLLLAIVMEAAGTTLLKMSEQFTKVVPSVFSLLCYVASLYLLSLCLEPSPSASHTPLGLPLASLSLQ